MSSQQETSMALVLVVDDEPLIRMATIDLVEAAGYRAIEAGSADEAMLLLETRDDIRVLLTDVNMPGSMDGIKLAAAVRDRWPPISIIVISGQHALQPGEIPSGALFFPKPIPEAHLVAALHTLA